MILHARNVDLVPVTGSGLDGASERCVRKIDRDEQLLILGVSQVAYDVLLIRVVDPDKISAK